MKRVALRGRVARERRELVKLRDDLVDLARPIEGRTRPRRREITPLRQVPRRLAQPIDGPLVAAEGAAAQRAAHAFRRIRQLFLQPAAERLVEQPPGRGLGEDLEQRVDPGFDRPLAQQVGAEAVNRADVRFLEPLERLVEPGPPLGAGRRGRARAIETLAKPQLQLAGRLLRERHRDDLADVGAPFGEDRDDPADELGRLAGAGRRLDDQRVVEGGRDRVARRRVGRVRARCAVMACSSTRVRSPSRSAALRATCFSSSGPQTARKSHQVQARARGRGRQEAELDRAIDDLERFERRAAVRIAQRDLVLGEPAGGGAVEQPSRRRPASQRIASIARP